MFTLAALPSVMIFLSIATIFLSCMYLHLHSKQSKVKKIVLLFAVSLLTCFAVMREVSYGIGGTDAITYVVDFLNMQGNLSNYIDFDKVLNLRQREPLYYLFGWSVRRITDDYKIYFLFIYLAMAIAFVCVSAKSYKKEDLYLGSVLPLLLFYVGYIHSFNVMRNWLAIAIAMVGMTFLRQGKYKYYFIFLLMAVGMHYSAFVLVLPFIMVKLFNRFTKMRFPLLMFIVVGNVLIYSYVSLFGSIFANTKFSSYMEMQSSWFGYLPVLFIAVCGIIFYSDLVRMSPDNKIVLLGVALNAAMFIAYIKIGAYRINDCFVVFRVWLLIELGKLFYRKYKGWKRVGFVYGMNLFVVAYFFQQLNLLVRMSGVVPYRIG